jgi:DNA polymerase III subunit alpha
VVLVRGRVDHKEAGKTCVVVQSAESFAPSDEEILEAKVKADRDAANSEAQAQQPLRLRVDPARLQASVIEDLKHLIESFPGPTEVVLEMDTTAGPRRLRLGEAYRVAPSPTLLAEFEQVLAA